MKYAAYTGLVTNSDGTQVSIREGEIWEDSDVTVREHPDKFTDTEPNSETAGAFPMEQKHRSTVMSTGDGVEAKRMEGEHPRGYPLPGEPEPTRATDFQRLSDADNEVENAKRADAEKAGEAEAKPAKRASAPKVERTTRAPGERR